MTLKLNVAKVSKQIKGGSLKGLELAGEHVLQVSNGRVPLEEGSLMRSGRVTVVGKEVAISYDTPYAVVQHEEMHYRHKNGRRAKYLESAINDSKEDILKIVQQEAKKEIG